MKNTVLFCCGASGSGKSYFIEHFLPSGVFYKLKSATTRPMRAGEKDGREYFFRDVAYFDATPLVTYLWVNQAFWTPDQPKWIYGVPESEVFNNLGHNFVYDVIQPKYARQMMDWFVLNKLHKTYTFKTAYFLAPKNNLETAASRANMPNDDAVRRANTCEPIDFLHAGLDIDFLIRNTPDEQIFSPRLQRFLIDSRQR